MRCNLRALIGALGLLVCVSVASAAVDFDGDLDVDQADFGHLQLCLGESGQPTAPGCNDADVNGDGAVDQQDLASFLACVSGPSMLLGADCRPEKSGLSLLDEDTDLDLSGQVVYAVDVGGRQRYGPTIVGGAVFLEDLNGDGPYPPAPGIIPGYTTVFQHAWNSPDPTAPGLTYLRAILGTWGYKDLNVAPLSCSMNNIVPGRDYTLQLMWADGWWNEHIYLFDVYVNGTLVADNLAPRLAITGLGGTNLGTQGVLFTYRFVAADTQLTVELRHAGSYPPNTSPTAFLSGLLLTTPSDSATYPRPFNNSIIWDPDATRLSWSPGRTAISQDLYFGDNYAAVLNANHSSPTFKGTCNNFDPRGDYTSASTYYWRVDEVTPTGTIKGSIWSFSALRVASDVNQPAEARAAELVSVMTLEEKAAQMVNYPPGNARVGIPKLTWQNECLHGIMANNVTVFPQAIALASMWDPDLMQQVANAISDEARALYNTGDTGRGLTYWSPVINMARDPRWGRTQETYGEDPFLTAETGMAFVRGLQGDDPRYIKIVATPKHFAANNQEVNRTSLSATINERWLREYYLPHFKKCVVDAGAFSVMSAYNAINGVPCSASGNLLTTILRNEWGFAGYVTSDCGAIALLKDGHHYVTSYEAAVAAGVLAGVDVECGDSLYHQYLPTAVSQGRLTEANIDTSITRLLTARFKLGMFDPPELVPWSGITTAVIDSPAHRALALQSARKAIVLLQNTGNILPLNAGAISSIAVIGPLANVYEYGDYSGTPTHAVNPLQGIINKVPPGVTVSYAQGCGVNTSGSPDPAAVNLAAASNVAILFVGLDGTIENEGIDRSNITLPGIQENLITAVRAVNPNTIVVFINGSGVAVSSATQANVPAFVEAWYDGEEAGTAIADVLFGTYNPAGRLPVTVYSSLSQLPSMTSYNLTSGTLRRTYMYFTGTPQWRFGHGLSYTSFAYSNLQLSSSQITDLGSLTVSVDVTNTGTRLGEEVVQLYVHDVAASVTRAVKELKGFKRISLAPQATQTVTFTVPASELAYWDSTTRHAFYVEPGTFQVMVGASSADIRLQSNFEVVAH